METHEVLKPFNGTTRRLEPGERVDASNWRNTAVLVDQRYLKPLPVIAERVDDRRPPQQKGGR